MRQIPKFVKSFGPILVACHVQKSCRSEAVSPLERQVHEIIFLIVKSAHPRHNILNMNLKESLSGLNIWQPLGTFQADVMVLENEVRNTLERIKNLRPPMVSSEPLCSIETVAQSVAVLGGPLQVDEEVFAMYNLGKPWVKAKIRAIYLRPISGSNCPVLVIRLRAIELDRTFEVNKYLIARNQRHGSALRVPKRVVAGHNENELIPGILGQEPCDHNKNRYMVLFDNGSAGYFKPDDVYPICYQSTIPWRDFRHTAPSNEYLHQELAYFFKSYPMRKLMYIKVGQLTSIARRGLTLNACVTGIDCDVAHLIYPDRKTESVYLGSARLIKRSDLVRKMLVSSIDITKLFSRLPGHMHRYHEAGRSAMKEPPMVFSIQDRITILGATAKKSTSTPAQKSSKIVFEDLQVDDDRKSLPKLQEYINDREYKHKCNPDCLKVEGVKTEISVLDLVDEYRDICDLKVPLLLGWRRTIVKATRHGSITRIYIYESPCRKIFRQMSTIRNYLQATGSKLDIDYFTFDLEVDLNRPTREFHANCFVENFAKDENDKPLENKHISVVNEICQENLPFDFVYRNKTIPHPNLRKRGYSPNEDFKSACGCENNCQSRTSCACQLISESVAKDLGIKVGTNAYYRPTLYYKNKRLHEQVMSGIFECNSFCACDSRCPNRVVQNGIRFRLQIRKMPLKGWGIVTLDDIPAGAFVCTYSAVLLDDANQYGEDDMYFADLDYITVNERAKQLEEDERSDEGLSADGSEPGESDKESKSDKGEQVGYEKIHTFLNESHDYTLDAKLEGNIGRFLNHSCDPNMFVQNVFIETHDPRFPQISFFARRAIKGGEEVTWNYNYHVGSIPGRVMYCSCGAPNCKGRIL